KKNKTRHNWKLETLLLNGIWTATPTAVSRQQKEGVSQATTSDMVMFDHEVVEKSIQKGEKLFIEMKEKERSVSAPSKRPKYSLDEPIIRQRSDPGPHRPNDTDQNLDHELLIERIKDASKHVHLVRLSGSGVIADKFCVIRNGVFVEAAQQPSQEKVGVIPQPVIEQPQSVVLNPFLPTVTSAVAGRGAYLRPSVGRYLRSTAFQAQMSEAVPFQQDKIGHVYDAKLPKLLPNRGAAYSAPMASTDYLTTTVPQQNVGAFVYDSYDAFQQQDWYRNLIRRRQVAPISWYDDSMINTSFFPLRYAPPVYEYGVNSVPFPGQVQNEGERQGLWYPYNNLTDAPYFLPMVNDFETMKIEGIANHMFDNHTSNTFDFASFLQKIQPKDICKGFEPKEYYFSDKNLSHDEFLQGLMCKHGWVKVRFLVQFPRLKQMQATAQDVVASISSSDILEVMDGKIRRKNDWKKYLPNQETISSPLLKAIAFRIEDHYAKLQQHKQEDSKNTLTDTATTTGNTKSEQQHDTSQNVTDTEERKEAAPTNEIVPTNETIPNNEREISRAVQR
ncbi:hypothetical protein RFI_08937, partial [Reticulomyxa filosa]